MIQTKLTVTMSEVERFKGSPLWKDMKREVIIWQRGLRDLILVGAGAEEDERNRGRMDACKYFLALPDVILDELRNIREEKEDAAKNK